MSDPISKAETIFRNSLTALMAHTIRGTQKHFREHGLSLDLQLVKADTDIIPLEGPGGVVSILQTTFLPAAGKHPDTVRARIFLHQQANKDLARICIAHEIFHLLMELQSFEKHHQDSWPTIQVTKELESQCDQFAWELCFQYDRIYRDEDQRRIVMYYPEHLFERPLCTDLSRPDDLSPGLDLNEKHPFYKAPDLW